MINKRIKSRGLSCEGEEMRKRKEPLNEKQQIERGKAYRNAFFTLLIAFFVCLVVNGILEKPILDAYTMFCISVLLSFSVFSTTAIVRNALYVNKEIQEDLWLYCVVTIMLGVAFILFFVFELQHNEIIKDGVLHRSILYAVQGLCMIEIGSVYLVKYIRDIKKAKAAEEPDQLAE